MNKNYEKPVVVKEETLERSLVYAEPVNEREGCTTIVN